MRGALRESIMKEWCREMIQAFGGELESHVVARLEGFYSSSSSSSSNGLGRRGELGECQPVFGCRNMGRGFYRGFKRI